MADDAQSMRRAVETVQSPESPVSLKMRSLFYLRSLESPEASLCIQECMSNTSVLLDHEVAYVLGQMKQPNSVAFLLAVAEDRGTSAIVRHEAVEALGNFEDTALVPRIEAFLTDPDAIVRESAVLALQKLRECSLREEKVSRYGSRDPAFPFEGRFEDAVCLLRTGDIVEKYRAVFYLRDLNTAQAVDALACAFSDPSDLLRHEVAFVLGQMQNTHAVGALIDVLENPAEKDIVRHEAAEALGNIGTEECVQCLCKYLNSNTRILRESAHVGLGISSLDPDEYLDV